MKTLVAFTLKKTEKFIGLVCMLAVLSFLDGCQVNDDSTIVPPPIADFTYTATNDQNAPSTVSFSNKVEVDVNYSWDLGNGQTFTGRDPIVTYSEEGTYTVTLTATGAGGTSQKTEDIVIGPFTVTADLIVGSWSIVHEEITVPGVATPIIYERPMNWERLSYYENGEYDRTSMAWVEYEHGSYTINNNVITQTPTGGNHEFSSVDVLITSMDEEGIEAEVDMVDPQEGTIHIEVLLQKLGPEYFGQGEFPMPSIVDFAGAKWSMLEETRTILEYSTVTGEYTDVVATETVSDIPYNYNTFKADPGINSSLYIDNWEYGMYEVYYNLIPLHTYTTYWLDVEEGGDEILVLITNNEDGNNIETTSVGFFEDQGQQYKFQAVTKFLRSNGSEPTITAEEFAGQWQVTAKTETRDGVAVDPADSYTPPVGAILTFNADGSAELGDPNPGSWFALDESNIVVVSPEGDETLVHITGFNAPAGELSTFSRWMEGDFLYEMLLSLEKQ